MIHDFDLAHHEALTRLWTDRKHVAAGTLTLDQVRANWRAGLYAGVPRELAADLMTFDQEQAA
jgi:hypothetical protein